MEALLVHQDNETSTSETKQLLEQLGHRATVAPAAEKGITLPDGAKPDFLIVFAEIYREKQTLELCHTLHAQPTLEPLPLLVGINMYQMPLANKLKQIPNTYYLFTPVREQELTQRLEMVAEAIGGDATALGQKS